MARKKNKKVAPSLKPPAPVGGNTMGTLGILPAGAMQSMLLMLSSKELLRIRAVSRGVATVAGPLITELKVAPRATRGPALTGRGDGEFCTRLFYMVTQVRQLEADFTLAVWDRWQQAGQDAIRTFLENMMAGPFLRHLQLRVDSMCVQSQVLRLLPMCAQHLEALALNFTRRGQPYNDRLSQEEAQAIALVVEECQFPNLQELELQGRVLQHAGPECPVGLLTIWDRDPQAFAGLHHVLLGDLQEFNPDIKAHLTAMGQRWAAAGPKQLRSLTSRFEPLEWTVGPSLAQLACTNAPSLVELDLGRAMSSVWLEGLLGVVAPAGGGGLLRKLSGLEVDDTATLLTAMREGRLAKLQELDVTMWPDEGLQGGDLGGPHFELVDMLAQDGGICPLLDTLSLAGWTAPGDQLLPRLWDLLAMLHRRIHSVKIELAAEPTMAQLAGLWDNKVRFQHLRKLQIVGSGVSCEAAANIIQGLPRTCAFAAELSLCLKVFWNNRKFGSGPKSTLRHLGVEYDTNQSPAALGQQLGLGEVCLR